MQMTETRRNADVKNILLELGIPVHRVGYKQLMCAILRFTEDDHQMLCSELYPYVAEQLHYTDGRAVEHAIRSAIRCAWNKGCRCVWEKYFPGCKRTPTNKRFIATIAEHTKK